jgi:hypothetical protein
VKRLAVRLDPYRSVWRAARLLGGTMAAVCRKEGASRDKSFEPFESLLRCPDCRAALARDARETLRCTSCTYASPLEGGVYNLLRASDKAELYPGDREDIIDFALPGHERRLVGHWHELEGVFGNKWRWIGPTAQARLVRVRPGPQRLRVRGSALDGHVPMHINVRVNGTECGAWTQDRPGLFVLEADLPDAPEYQLTVNASPSWKAPGDDRLLTVNLSMIRLVPRD